MALSRLRATGAARAAGIAGALSAVALLPHLGAAIPLRTYYFRDFGMAFYPFHLFWAREVQAGRWPFWIPHIQSGVPHLHHVAYPVDFLHAIWPSPEFVSWLLTMHYPASALGAYLLARELGAARAGAFVAGCAYALSGLAIASLNLYIFLQAYAWTPLLAWATTRALVRGGRWIPVAGAVLAVALTTAQEFIAQGLVLGLGLGIALSPVRVVAARAALAVATGVALGGLPLALVAGVLPETIRGRGLDLDQILQYSVHPATLLQLFLRDAFGSLDAPFEAWWGHRFFTRGFPYFVSMYLGPHVLAASAAGVGALPRRLRVMLLAVGAASLAYALGPWGGLAPVLATLPVAHSFRFPSKAMLLPTLVLVLTAGFGIDRLRRGEGWRAYRTSAALLCGVAAAVALLAFLAVDLVADWMWSDPAGNPLLRATLGRDALLTAIIAVLGVAAAAAVHRGAISATRGAVVVSVVLVLDLARAGTGINRQTTPAFFRPLPEMARLELDRLGGGRMFSYGTEYSRAFRRFLASRPPGAVLWGYFVRRQMLVPHANLLDDVESAFSDDPGSFVFTMPELSPHDHEPGRVASILAALRNAAVSRVLSLDPLDHPDLRLLARVETGAPGLAIHVYDLVSPWPRAYVACRVTHAPHQDEALVAYRGPGFDPATDVALEEETQLGCTRGEATRRSHVPGRDVYDVDSDGPGVLVTRDSHARGWRATVDGRPVPVLRANGKHRAVRIGGGRRRVEFEYVPPGLGFGLGLMTAGGLMAATLVIRPVLREPSPPTPGEDGG